MSAVFLFVIEKHRLNRKVMNVWKFEMTHDVRRHDYANAAEKTKMHLTSEKHSLFIRKSLFPPLFVLPLALLIAKKCCDVMSSLFLVKISRQMGQHVKLKLL